MAALGALMEEGQVVVFDLLFHILPVGVLVGLRRSASEGAHSQRLEVSSTVENSAEVQHSCSLRRSIDRFHDVKLELAQAGGSVGLLDLHEAYFAAGQESCAGSQVAEVAHRLSAVSVEAFWDFHAMETILHGVVQEVAIGRSGCNPLRNHNPSHCSSSAKFPRRCRSARSTAAEVVVPEAFSDSRHWQQRGYSASSVAAHACDLVSEVCDFVVAEIDQRRSIRVCQRHDLGGCSRVDSCYEQGSEGLWRWGQLRRKGRCSWRMQVKMVFSCRW